MKFDKEKIIKEIKLLRKNYIKCRAYFPCLSEEIIGEKQFITPDLYRKKGYKIVFEFHEPITEKDIRRNNEIGHWINQNVIIRLYALLDSNHVVVDIDKCVDGGVDVDIVKRLRNPFAHGSGHYNKKAKHRKLVEDINMHFDLNYDPNKIDEFPLSIDKIILPLFDGCIKYIQNLNNK